MLVLENHNGVAIEVRDVRSSLDLGIVVEYHPANVREEETPHHRVRVLHGIRPAMMCPVIGTPPSDAALDGAGACKSQEQTER